MPKKGISFFSIFIIVNIIIFITISISKVYSVDSIKTDVKIEKKEVSILKTITDEINIEPEDERSRKIRKAIESRRWD